MPGGAMLAALAVALAAPQAQDRTSAGEVPDQPAFVRACSDRLPLAKLEDTGGHASSHHPARGHTPSTSSAARGAARQNPPELAALSWWPLLCGRRAVPSPLHLRL